MSVVLTDVEGLIAHLADHPASPLAVQLAVHRLDQGDFAAAAQVLEPLTAACPDYPTAQLLLGQALLSLGEYDGATQALGQAIRMQPNSRTAQRVFDLAVAARAAAEPEAELVATSAHVDDEHPVWTEAELVTSDSDAATETAWATESARSAAHDAAPENTDPVAADEPETPVTEPGAAMIDELTAQDKAPVELIDWVTVEPSAPAAEPEAEPVAQAPNRDEAADDASPPEWAVAEEAVSSEPDAAVMTAEPPVESELTAPEPEAESPVEFEPTETEAEELPVAFETTETEPTAADDSSDEPLESDESQTELVDAAGSWQPEAEDDELDEPAELFEPMTTSFIASPTPRGALFSDDEVQLSLMLFGRLPQPTAAADLLRFARQAKPTADRPATRIDTSLLDSWVEQLSHAPRLRADDLPREAPTPAPRKAQIVSETMGEIYIRQGEYSKALDVYEQLMDQRPERRVQYEQRLTEIERLLNGDRSGERRG